MLKGRGRDPRVSTGPAPVHLAVRPPTQAHPGARPTQSPTHLTIRTPTLTRAPLAKPEPDYEVVEFPSEQYVNAKLQPPPPPPPRPPTGHPVEAASCGLCGGGGARVRCTECGRRALCASCDDMYHRHPKRRHHQRQALSPNQIRDERPPLPPKGTPPVPPPRRHKISGDRMSASPRPPSSLDQRNSALAPHPMVHTQTMPLNNRMASQNVQQIPAHLQKLPSVVSGGHLGSTPYLPTAHHTPVVPTQVNAMGHLVTGWQRPRGSLPGFNIHPNVPMAPETWEAPEAMVTQSWGRPLRRGASVLELGGGPGGACGGCGGCGGGWRYGSCASLDHQAWAPAPGWPQPQPPCCHPQMHQHAHPPPHMHAPYTPQPYRRAADSRAASRVASRTGSRAASPAMSVRSRASRRNKHRTPSPPPLPSSDADSESESDEHDRPPPKEPPPPRPPSNASVPQSPEPERPMAAVAVPRAAWQCEHCTFVNEAGVRVCAVCCRTPTAAPRELASEHRAPVADTARSTSSPTVSESARSIAETARGMERLDLGEPVPARPKPEPRAQQNGETTRTVPKKERISTGCGPSPPRDDNVKKQNSRLVTPTREQSVESRTRHDMAVGSSPPRELQTRTSATRSPPRQNASTRPTSPRQNVRASPYKEARQPDPPTRHSISVGPSPPRENSTRASPVQKKSTGTSPPRERDRIVESRSSTLVRANVSNTGTSPPPQSISTQTYEVPPNAWERAPSAVRARSRRRFRDDARRERSHSRHSLSSDTRESERSARTSGGGEDGGGGGSSGRWEWRETRDSSPTAEWSGSERRPARLARRASHLDLRRDRHPPRRSSFYRSEAASPEPTRALSLEALASSASAAAASRGLELARLMAEAERLGFSAAEVQAALAQSPSAPLAWLRSRWASLCAGVRAAAARLAPHAHVGELEARAALARHRGAMWPAVTDCVERHRRQNSTSGGGGVGGGDRGGGGVEGVGGGGGGAERRHGGRVWGSPAGADDDAAPPRGLRAEDSSDEFDGPPPTYRDDDWMYLPLDTSPRARRPSVPADEWDAPDVAMELSRLLAQADDHLILTGLLSSGPAPAMLLADDRLGLGVKPNSVDFIQSENDFIDAYNALTRSTPLPSVDDRLESARAVPVKDPKRDKYDVNENDLHTDFRNSTNLSINNNERLINTSEITMESIDSQTIIREGDRLQAIAKNNVNASNNANTSNNNRVINAPQIIMDSTNSTAIVIEGDQLQATAKNNVNSMTNTQVINTPEKIDSNNLQATEDTQFQEITNVILQEEASISSPDRQNRTSEEKVVISLSTISQVSESVPRELRTNEDHQQTLSDNFEEPLLDVPTVVSTAEENVTTEVKNSFGSELEVNQSIEKTSNLNEIVGNTQRLIQQMKDEINSDINYIDSRTASHSEADSSSNESDIPSEHESSYSDTEEKETDDLSSNESETASSESEDEHMNERRPTMIPRTSSDENDQFEEAMDHIEDQIEDFKHTNIEILDSIARSLQEEHIVSVQVREPNVHDKSQDLNNNLFVEVNSFDEIYAELNKPKKETVINQKIKNINTKPKPKLDLPVQVEIPKINMAKQLITVSHFEVATPIKPIISVTNHKILNAVIEDIEEKAEENLAVSIDNNNLIDNFKVEIKNNDDTHSINVQNTVMSSDETDSSDSEDSNTTPTGHNILISNANETLVENITQQKTSANNIIEITMENVIKENGTQPNLIENFKENNITFENASETNVELENIPDQNLVEVITEQNEVMGNITEQHNIVMEIANAQTTATENNIERNMKTINILDQNVENATEHNTIINNIDAKTVEDENMEPRIIENTENTETKGTSENNNNNSQDTKTINSEKHKSPSKSPSKSPPKSSPDSNKALVTNKSNIPKLVKVIQNNKQKGEKTAPKAVASKVPVRRTSSKQYPAPTPPKAHFGNVQSGHVKQLQTRLFNNKFPKTVVNVPDAVNVKASTSTMHKKKQAPPPPTSEEKRPSPTKASPPKEKKSAYFRESCRTEDEWTESEAEDAPAPATRGSEEPPQPPQPSQPPEPPPPVTVRRVSGQVIDLARVRLPEGSPERQARMLLASGATETWEQARLAVELVSRGSEAAGALLAALECRDLAAALAYLHQDCDLCAERLPEHEMVSMLRCTHRCCRSCARVYFTVQITERSIADCVCPFCKEPDLETTPEDAWLEYFAHLDILLKTLIEPDVHELFQRKLRDRTLALDPNFRWCMECSSGFFVHPKQKKIRCPECRSVSCAKCRKAWSVNHEGLSCEQYQAWLEDNDPERSAAAVQQHLRENGLECPRCHFKYSLSRGGCMHFTCTQCKYEFCYGCGKPFMMGARCGLSEYCARLGLHAHHPRNCLFYLRDKEPRDLQTLLQMNNVSYETEAPEGTNRCPIQLQRETPAGLVDGICGGDTPPDHAGLCKNHYLEYLSRLVRGRALEPLPLLDVEDLETLVRRAGLRPPPRPYGSLDGLYKRGLLAIVREKIPLD